MDHDEGKEALQDTLELPRFSFEIGTSNHGFRETRKHLDYLTPSDYSLYVRLFYGIEPRGTTLRSYSITYNHRIKAKSIFM